MIKPVQIDAADLEGWTDRKSAVLSFAGWWAAHIRRGRGKIPRMLGRLLGTNWRRILTTRSGAKLAIAPRALDVYALVKAKGMVWEPHVFETCRKLLKPRDVFYDIGANVGYMTIEMAVAFQGEVQCIAFEPQPDLARQIVISAQLNGVSDSVCVYDAMIGEETKEAKIMLTSHSGHASSIAREAGARQLSREMVSLDSLAFSGAIPPPSVIKIDVEGGELNALRGAQSLIRNHAPHIVFEVNENSSRFGYTRDDILQLLGQLADYEFFDLAEDLSLAPISATPIDGDILARSRRRQS